jgi:hypothetical protein
MRMAKWSKRQRTLIVWHTPNSFGRIFNVRQLEDAQRLVKETGVRQGLEEVKWIPEKTLRSVG